ncbi:hypothetical protein Golax_015583 [Gossypium laxum]|uniref:Uncharacterized protein n=1 Tax=Gossypium laxum TaxID=34288 RepID=A0A7J8ZZQ6_9ROSI|nr:hypothetical protein [Gossypium laxum]
MAEDAINFIIDRMISHIRLEIELLLNSEDYLDHHRNTSSAREAMLRGAGERSATSNLTAWLTKLEDEEQFLNFSDSYEKMGYGMAEPEHQSMSNGSKKRNLKFVSDDLRQEAERKKKQRNIQYRRQIRAEFGDDPTERGINNCLVQKSLEMVISLNSWSKNPCIDNAVDCLLIPVLCEKNGKITNWRCKWQRMVEMLLSGLKATNVGKTKASQQVLCHRNQMKMQWPIQSDPLLIIQVIQEPDRKCKVLDAKAKWRLLLRGETIEKLDRQRSEVHKLLEFIY